MRPVQIFIVGSCLFIAFYRSLAPQKQSPVSMPVPTPSATPVAEFKGTSNDYTPAERKAMIEAQTRARKEVEADAKAIANGTYKEPKTIATHNQTGSDTLPVANYKDCKPGVRTEANVINCGYEYPPEIAKLSYKEREKYRASEREKYQAEAEVAMQESRERIMTEDPEQAAVITEFDRQTEIILAEKELFIKVKMNAGFSEKNAELLWRDRIGDY